ncbi:MAG: SH3 domain-containing protein [Lachnospiraceae bacterium]|nr:SH3 domain-containing protein [Lachnospiraceae bacterium]
MRKLHEYSRSRKFYKWAAICAASFMFFMSGITGLAAQVGTVQSDNVNVRSEANASSDSVCKLPANTTVDVIDQAEDSDGQTWYNVSFIYEEAETSGWIRADMLTVSEVEDGQEAEGSGSGEYSIQEPEEAYAGSGSLTQTSIMVGDGNITAWQVDSSLTGGQELYLVYASKSDGSTGWFYYDPQDNTFQREMGQFSGSGESEGLIDALQTELTQRQEEHAKQLSQRLYIILGLAVLSVILLVLVIIFAIKYRDAAYEYYDDDEEDDEDDDEESNEIKGSSKSYDDDGFDDFVKAVKKKWAEPEDEDDELAYDEEDEYDDDEFDEDEFDDDEFDEDEFEEDEIEEEREVVRKKEKRKEEKRKEEKRKEERKKEEKKKVVRDQALEEDFSGILPEIDMSAVMEVEKEAQKKKSKAKQIPENGAEELEEDFDIDILDLDDLDL